MPPTNIVLVGAGHVGLYVARRLQRKLKRDHTSITVIDPHSYMTYQPLLSDAAAGSVEPRHVVVPLRQVLRRCKVITGEAVRIDSHSQTVSVEIAPDRVEQVPYDYLVVAPGSVSKVMPVPGLASEAIGFTTLGEAIYLRNHVLTQLDHASSTDDAELRERMLTFVFVGGGYAGVEALGQLEEMARFAVKHYYGDLRAVPMRWVLVDAADRIMPEVSLGLARYAQALLQQHGIDVRLNTTTSSIKHGNIELSDGTMFAANTVVWTAGVSPHPMLEGTDMPRDRAGNVRCSATLEVEGRTGVFAAGDAAAVPDLSSDDPNDVCPPSAQHATRQAKVLADNVVALRRGRRLKRYEHRLVGGVATLGRRHGVAEVYGQRLRGWPAWAIHRMYHLACVPSGNRRVRVAADWTIDLFFPRQVVALGELHAPAEEFTEQASS